MQILKCMKGYFPIFLFLITSLFKPTQAYSASQMAWYCKSFYSKTMKQPYQQQQSFWAGNPYNFQENFNKSPIFSKLEAPYRAPIIPYRPRSSYNSKETRNLDQGSSKECFIFAFIGGLESTLANQQGRNIQFYPEYLIAEKLKYTIQGLLEFNEDSTYYNLEGGQFFHAANLVRASGIIPIGANWEPLRKVIEWPFDHIYEEIRKQTLEAKNGIGKLNLSYDEKQKLIAKKTEEIFSKVLGPYVGILPNNFYYQGNQYTAISFAQQSLKNSNFLNESVVYLSTRGQLFPNSQVNQLFQQWKTDLELNNNGQVTAIGLSPVDFLRKIDQELMAGKAVVVDLDGKDSVSIGHTMVITDIEKNGLDFVAVKIKNSFHDDPEANYIWYKVSDLLGKVRRAWTINY